MSNETILDNAKFSRLLPPKRPRKKGGRTNNISALVKQLREMFSSVIVEGEDDEEEEARPAVDARWPLSKAHAARTRC